MEKAGTGIQRMREECLKNGNRIEIQFTDIFYDLTIFSNAQTTQETTQEILPGKTQEEILSLLHKNPKYTRQELAVILDKKDTTIKEHIAKLKKVGLLERVGSTKAGYWKVKEI